MVGLLDPLELHMPWNGLTVNEKNHYISFLGWIIQLQALMEQKPSPQWKMACLDTATLHCMRGRALTTPQHPKTAPSRAVRIDK